MHTEGKGTNHSVDRDEMQIRCTRVPSEIGRVGFDELPECIEAFSVSTHQRHQDKTMNAHHFAEYGGD